MNALDNNKFTKDKGTNNRNQENDINGIRKRNIIGIIGGSCLIKSKLFKEGLKLKVVRTPHGNVSLFQGNYENAQLVFCQRHHAEMDRKYMQPHTINYKAIAIAMKDQHCDIILGVYSVGSLKAEITVGRIVIPDDYFNPFDIFHISNNYDAHVVPGINEQLRQLLIKSLTAENFFPYTRGTYVQASGPRFETKAEIRFFSTFGDIIGMTGGHEVELMNELGIPCAMLGIVDNMANGLGEKLTLDQFKAAQASNLKTIENAVVCILNELIQNELVFHTC